MKYLVIILLSGVLLSAEAIGQRKERHILDRFSEQDIAGALIARSDWKPFPKTPDEWKKALPDSLRSLIIKRGENTLGFQWQSISASLLLTSVRTGDRTEYSDFQAKKRAALLRLVLAETVEGKGRFMEDIMNGIWSTCEETYWGIPVHLYLQKAKLGLPDVEQPTVDLVAAETGVMIALADYFLAPALETKSKLLRPRIEYELKRRILTPMETARYQYLGNTDNRAVNNWNPWIISNWQFVNLIMEKDEAKRAKMLHYSMQLLDNYFDSLGDDGGCDEGPSYWFLAGGSMFDALEVLFNATSGKVNVYQEPLVRKMAAYIYKTHIEGKYFVNTADASPTISIDAPFLYRVGKAIEDPLLVQLAVSAFDKSTRLFISETNTKPRMLSNWLTLPPISQEAKDNRTTAPLLPSSWISDIQLMTARTTDGLFVASHAGHNAESHNHNDVGDFIVYAGGYPVIIDAGAGTYNAKTFTSERYNVWNNASAFHNLPTINGIQQLAGREAEATGVNFQEKPKAVSLSMDLAKSFPKETGLKNWKRAVKSDQTRTISVTDSFETSEKLTSLTQTFMTICDSDLSQPGKIIFVQPGGKKVLLTYDAKKWKASQEKLRLKNTPDEIFLEKWQCSHITRILLTNQSLAAKDTFTFVITNL